MEEDNFERAIQTDMILGRSVLSLEESSFIESLNVNSFEAYLEKMIKEASTKKDLYRIGALLDYAIDNKLKINTCDYQFKAAKKMTEIENKIEESEKEVA